MQEIDAKLDADGARMKKKEVAGLTRTSSKLHRNLDGIAKMNDLPAALIVVDVCHEHIAVAEAVKLGIPIVAIIDTNANPDDINYPIVANDDAVKSISVLINVMADAIKVANDMYIKKAEAEKARIEAEKAEAAKIKAEAAAAKKAESEAAKKEKAATKKPAAKKAPAKKKPAKKATPASDTKKEEAAKPAKSAEKAPAEKAPAEKKEEKKAE
jgi:small subunit ribosomal protein S2